MLSSLNNSSASELVISDEVIASIALSAAADVPGVGKTVQKPKSVKSIVGLFEGAPKSVEVIKNDNVYTLKLFLTVDVDARIPSVAAQVQKAVKNAVQEMTSMVVSKVNVVIAGVEIADTEPTQMKND